MPGHCTLRLFSAHELPKEPPCALHNAAKHINKTLGNAADGVQNQFARADGGLAVVQAAIEPQGKIRQVFHVHREIAVQGVGVQVDPAAAVNLQPRPLEIKVAAAGDSGCDVARGSGRLESCGLALELPVRAALLI